MKSRRLSRNIKSFISLTPLQKPLVAVVRGLRKRLAARPARSSNPNRPSSGGLLKKAAIVGLVLGGIALVAYPIVTFVAVDLKTVPFSSITQSKQIVSSRLNILVGAFDQEGEYYFLDSLAVLSLDVKTNSFSVIMLNTDFSSRVLGGEYISIRNLINNASLVNADPITKLTDLAEQTLGLPVDRYLMVRTSDLAGLLETFGIEYLAAEDLHDADIGTVAKNQKLTGRALVNYLAADAAGTEAKQVRAIKFVSEVYKSYRLKPWDLYRFDQWLSKVYTNLSKLELFTVGTSIWNVKEVRSTYVGINESFLIKDKVGSNYVINSGAIDEKIRSIFSKTEVYQEQVRIEVYNATGKNGIAGIMRRFLRNFGANVVRVGNFAEPEQENVIYVAEPEKYPENIRLIQEVLRGDVRIEAEEFPLNHSAEIVLVVGRYN